MSFRTRLALFFVLIVVVPMIALVVVASRLVADSEHGKAHARVDAYAAIARDAYRDTAQAGAHEARALASDRVLAAALRLGDAGATRARIRDLAHARGLARVVVFRGFVSRGRSPGQRRRPFVAFGDPSAVSGGSALLRAANQSIVAIVGVSTSTANRFAQMVATPTTRIAIMRGPAAAATILATTLPHQPAAHPRRTLPARGTITLDQTDYAVASFHAADLAGQEDTISVLTDASGGLSGAITRGRELILALLGAFLLLALAGALLVSRQLQGQLGRLLTAVKRIAGGDLAYEIPVRGGDELAALGREFSSLSGELAQVKRLAVTDELTGLFNHRRFQEVIASEAATAERFEQPLGLLMLDVDNFKHVNDTYGHPQGDVVLREVARVLREQSREIDEPARYGGEEMAVALPQTDLEGAFVIAERVREAVEALAIARLDGGGFIGITVSCGVASSIDGGKDALITDADAALYTAKRTGKNRSVCAPARAMKPLPIDEVSV